MAGRGGGLDSLKTARMTRRRLPIGIQTFRKIREQDCYYVDKTAYVERLLREGTHYFLSRPRRFGKSLFLDTLKELFEGNEALFSGLYIHSRHDWSQRHPVVRLSFGGGSFTEPATLREDVMAQNWTASGGIAGWGCVTTPLPRAFGICCRHCTNTLDSGSRCWWTSTTSRFWTRWWRCRRWRAPTATTCAGCTG